ISSTARASLSDKSKPPSVGSHCCGQLAPRSSTAFHPRRFHTSANPLRASSVQQRPLRNRCKRFQPSPFGKQFATNLSKTGLLSSSAAVSAITLTGKPLPLPIYYRSLIYTTSIYPLFQISSFRKQPFFPARKSHRSRSILTGFWVRVLRLQTNSVWS